MESKTRLVIAVLLIAVSAGLVAAGIMRGETVTVLTKAVNICLECIGIG